MVRTIKERGDFRAFHLATPSGIFWRSSFSARSTALARSIRPLNTDHTDVLPIVAFRRHRHLKRCPRLASLAHLEHHGFAHHAPTMAASPLRSTLASAWRRFSMGSKRTAKWSGSCAGATSG